MTSRRTFLASASAVAVTAASGHLAGAAMAAGQVSSGGTPTQRECVTIVSGGATLFAMVHRPTAASGRRPAVLMLHGLMGSKDQPHRVFVSLAERLARAGVVSQRVDLPGRGDSEGESIDIHPTTDLAAAQDALSALARRPDVDPDRVSLLGFSWGGMLAAQMSSRADRVVLWSCVPDDHPRWTPRLEMWDGREAHDEWGNLIGRQFYDALPAITPLSDLRASSCRVLLVYGTADRSVAAAAPGLQTALGDRLTAVAIEGADHAFLRHRYERGLFEATVPFLTVP